MTDTTSLLVGAAVLLAVATQYAVAQTPPPAEQHIVTLSCEGTTTT
jgi:hypothetical protein